ncbi:Probable cytosolic oligopeptidase A [Eumeta japonica]|uniref:Probable cytosolic oligopeptidase A n=1 Tax=Eumeta variegata TaxID=151549 RepID=A0A4C1T5L7_EUMVA|nr:Probable cytosolic oligopeptidase A [Eumeta japonica]
MALSLLRKNMIARHVKRQLYHKRNAGYVVLIPEIGEDSDKNILLSESGLPEFNDITIEKCIAAISKESLEYENGIKQIEANSPNCKNAFTDVFQPMEHLDSQLEFNWGMAKTLYLGNSSLMPTKSYLKIHERAYKAKSSKFNSLAIFQAAVNEKDKLKKISDEEQRLLDKHILEGKLNGLSVQGMKKDRLNNILIELQKERHIYSEKVKVATNKFSYTFDNSEVVRDFPDSLLKAMALPSADIHTGPWKTTLQPHIYEPFMQYCSSRQLRWNAWQAYIGRCSGYNEKELETSTHLEQIRKLRQNQAQILGYDSYVDMSMETKMARTAENVNRVIHTLLQSARPMQERELEDLKNFAKDRGFDDELDYCDIPYWQRKQKWSLYGFDENKVKEYFPLPKVINSLFNLCTTLFKIQIVEHSGVHTWHKDVKFYDIFDDSSNKPIAGFYLDPYAREDEKIRIYEDAGWHVTILNRSTIASSNPLSALIFNFDPPVESKPALLSFSDVRVLFQKFGHSLRHLLTKANYSEVAGLSNVEWDAAEVCGQVMTHWLYEPATVQALSGHYATDEPLPDAIIHNLQNLRSHMSGYNLCKELYLSKLDLELHSGRKFWRDVVRDLWPKYHVLPFNKYDSHPLTFTKIISEEWGAAYYSRIWSQMIAADIYSAFEEARQGKQDILEVGKRYRDTFLALGGSCHPSEVFRRFRGRDPSPNALLNNLGLSGKPMED